VLSDVHDCVITSIQSHGHYYKYSHCVDENCCWEIHGSHFEEHKHALSGYDRKFSVRTKSYAQPKAYYWYNTTNTAMWPGRNLLTFGRIMLPQSSEQKRLFCKTFYNHHNENHISHKSHHDLGCPCNVLIIMRRHQHVTLSTSLPQTLSLHPYVYAMRNYSSGPSLSTL